jgi:glycosyltransferase, family 1
MHFGFLGRIVEDKGLGYLVEAFSRLSDPNCRLLIGGDYLDVAGGSVLTELETRVRQDSRIEVLGLLRGVELNDFYASIDVFVLPSVAESFGIVQAEAIMMGIPSITTNLPGGRYPVKATGMGWIVEPRSVQSLFQAMKNALSSDWSADRNQMEWARSEFGVDTFLKKHLEVLELD